MRVREIVEAIGPLAPPSLSEAWDNCGLQVGDPGAAVSKILVALTPLPEVFDEAEELGADFLLFHHPLIFGGLQSLDVGSYPGDLMSRAIKTDTTVYAAHTSYDTAPNGVSVVLAEALRLAEPLKVLSPRDSLCKLVVFVPEEAVDPVADALSEAGAGVIGEYTHCTFRTPGTGTFLPGESADPYLGERGQLEKAGEIRLETVVPAYAASRAAAAATEAHPYEEAALDIYPVEGYPEGCGYGRIGGLQEPPTPEGLREHVSNSLGFPARLVAAPDPERTLRRVAVLGGSGGSFIREAASGAGRLRYRRSGLSRRAAGRITGPDRHRRRTRRDRVAVAPSARPASLGSGRRAGRGQPGPALEGIRPSRT